MSRESLLKDCPMCWDETCPACEYESNLIWELDEEYDAIFEELSRIDDDIEREQVFAVAQGNYLEELLTIIR